MPADRSDAQLAEELAARTLALVDIASESRDEARLHAHIEAELRAGGVEVRDAGDGCLVAEIESADGAGAPLVLAGHLDTVPAQSNIPGHRDDEHVHGLGASDMKGAVAVMLGLGLALAQRAPAVPTVLCLFGREELPFHDTSLTPLLEREPTLRAAGAAAIVMEPTDNAIHAGCLGNLNATWTFHGTSGHSARPWLADNAIERAARGIARLAAAAPPDAHTIDGLTFTEVASVTEIHGGIARNVIPDRVTAHVNYRYAPDRSAAAAEEHLRALLGGEGEEVAIDGNAPSGAVTLDHPHIAALIAAGDLAVAPKQAWTPVAEFAAAGVPAINFGPGDPAFAHRRDERIRIDALVRSVRVLERVLWP